MMPPSAYREEEKRYEAETTAHIPRERKQRPAANKHWRYTREILPPGCILYQMVAISDVERSAHSL